MKKVLSALMVAVMLIGMLPTIAIPVAAEKFTEGYLTYEIVGEKAHIIRCDNDNISGDFEIPSTLGGYPVTSIRTRAFPDCWKLTSITIPETVTIIEDEAFYDCFELIAINVDVENPAFSSENGVLFNKTKTMLIRYPWGKSDDSYSIPDGVMSIGNFAFSNCSDLTSINFSNSVATIGNYAFESCRGFTTFNTPDSVTSIGDGAFSWCTGLTSITIGSGVTTIADFVFEDCPFLSAINVDVDNPIFSSEDGVLFDKEKTTLLCYPSGKGGNNYSISNGVTTIGNYAFYGCHEFTSFNIPDSVTAISDTAFFYCLGLTAINVDANNPAFSSENGVLFDKTKTTLLCYPSAKNDDNNHIPNGVINIGKYAFAYCTELTSSTLPDSVNSIGDSAFYACYALTSVAIPDSVTSIGSAAFSYSGLTSINIPNGITSIENEVFSWCNKLTSVTLPVGVTSIGSGAFYECTGMSSITIPKSVISIGKDAFGQCYGLASVFYQGFLSDKQNIIIGDGNFLLMFANWYCACEKHIYDNDCDAICNNCNAPREVAGHQYDHACDAICNNCNAPREVAGHQYDNACDANCNNCNAPREVAGHQYDHACDTECNICKAIRSITHTYDHACDAECNICKATRAITHSYGEYVYNNDATTVADGTKTRACSVCGAKETVAAEGTKIANPFTDVKADKFYTESVLWAVEKGITNGLTETTFGPGNACTRGHIVTFLWRAAGSPEPKTTTNPFTDVKEGKFYYKAVLWAVENGITKGLTDTTFGPGNTCTRGQVVTFLWRAKGGEKVSAANPFADVNKGFYVDAVAWAVKNEITAGTSKTEFSPANDCTRGQIVTFLYRAYK